MKFRKTILAVSGALVLCVTAVHAQVQQTPKDNPQAVTPISPLPPVNAGASGGFGKAPVPAARGVSPAADPQPYDPAQVEPDTNTLSGAELFGLGSLEHSRNIFDPSLYFTGQGQTGVTGSAGQTSVQPTALFGGSLNFNRIWSRYRFTAVYSGGDNISGGSQVSAAFHDLSVTQEIEWQRWRLHLRDDFVASPGASFTGSGMGGPGLIGQLSSALPAGLTGVAQGFAPSETIQSGQAMRYEDMILGEAEYSFSRRSAFTFSGSYGLLHFPSAGYIDSHNVNGQVGYDFQLDPRNSIAVLASYSKISYNATPASTTNYVASLAYGRKIAGRLSFQATGGPSQIRSAGTGNGNFQSLTWSINSALRYELRRTGYSLSYSHGLTGGSGVLYGANSDTISVSVHRQFTRFWAGSANGGYAFNKSLAPAGVATFNFTNWFFGANIGRQLGRHVRFALNYGLQQQNSPAVCPVASCGATGLQQTFGMTVNWRLRPAG
jgi:hypothetical protein